MEDDIKCILQDKQFHQQLKSEQKETIQIVLERKECVAVIIQLVSRDHVYRFENESKMAK
jgi:hypothetical protein